MTEIKKQKNTGNKLKKFLKLNGGGILLISAIAALYLSLIFNDSVWGDEAYTMVMLRANPADMVRATAADVHPPLYYFIAKLFTTIFGYSVTSVKLASIVPLVLTMIFVWYKAKQIFQQKARLIATIFILLIGLTPIAFTLGVELRMYTWAMLFVTCSGVYAYQIYKSPSSKKTIALFILASLGAAYTHYYAALSECFIYLASFVALITKDRKNFKLCAVITGLTLIGYLPWLPTFLRQFGKTSQSWWLTTFNADSVLGYITFLFDGKFTQFYLIILGIIVVGGVLLCWQRRRTAMKDTDLYFALVAISILCLTVAVGCVASKLIRPLFLARYMYPSAGLFFLGISIYAANVEYSKLACCAIVAVILVNLPFSYNQTYIAEYKTGTEKFKQFAAENFKDGAKVSTDMVHLYWTLLPYYAPKQSVHTRISADTRGYVITAQKRSDLEKIIPDTEIDQVFCGDIDSKYKFCIYYVE